MDCASSASFCTSFEVRRCGSLCVAAHSARTRPRSGQAADQSYAGSAGIFSRRTNRTREARVYSHDGPIVRGKR
eukprot:3286651-Pyramimonas_sp.AAC.1